jgi:hypothetical protein
MIGNLNTKQESTTDVRYVEEGAAIIESLESAGFALGN